MIAALIILSIFTVAAIVWAVSMMKKADASKSEAMSLKTSLEVAQSRLTDAASRLADADKRLAAVDADRADLQSRLAEQTAQAARLNERIAGLEAQARESADRIAREREEQMQKSEERFKVIANDILDVNSRKFKEQNEARLSEILTPLKNDIEAFKRTVTETYSTEARERYSLQQSLKEMIDINRSIGREAKQLTEALRGNSKVQGDWGELILEKILEKSGLKKGVNYHVQVTTDDDGHVIKDDAGRMLRPDVMVDYPDGRCLIIDSKVSLTAYINYVNAEDDAAMNDAGRQHLLSVRAHIKELSEKRYQDFVGDKKADFVMMFIPNEGAYMTAMNLAPELWQEAYDRRVLIVSPTHLISALKLIEQLWRQDDIRRNVVEIAAESGKMYDKFVNFIDDMDKIDRSIAASRAAYDSAFKKLSSGTGNLVNRAEKIRSMGAKASKRLPSKLTGLPDDPAAE